MKKTAMLALAGVLASGATFAESTPVKKTDAQPKASQGACGEGKCAATSVKKEGEELKICGEGQSPDKDNCKTAEGACGGKSGEGACGATGTESKSAEGACGGKSGEGACGATGTESKSAEGACGGKSGEGACGADKKAKKKG